MSSTRFSRLESATKTSTQSARLLPRWFAVAASNVLIGLVFCAGALGDVYPARYVVCGFLTVLLLFLGAEATGRPSLMAFSLVLVPLLAALMVIFTLAPNLDLGLNDRTFRYVALYPAAVVTGFLFLRVKSRQITFARVHTIWALFMAIAAILEKASGANLFGRPILLNLSYGEMRSFLLSEHPLVLAALLAAAAPGVWTFRSWKARTVLLVVIAFGIWSTGSDGCMALFLAFNGVKFVTSRGGHENLGRQQLLLGALIVALAAWLVLPGLVSSALTSVSSADPNVASTQYRFVLYASLGKTLGMMVWGWGLEGIPAGVFLVPSPQGILDLSRTIDSEAVFSGFEFGVVGLIVFVGIMILPLLPRARRSISGEIALVVSTAGLFLALHAWVGLGTFWLFAVGGVLGHMLTRDDSEGIETAKEPDVMEGGGTAIRRRSRVSLQSR